MTEKRVMALIPDEVWLGWPLTMREAVRYGSEPAVGEANAVRLPKEWQ